MPTERRRVVYAGRVQGVGFRYTAERLAQGFAVTGFVRNEPDRTVELVAQGESAVVDAFLGSVREAMGPKIHSEAQQILTADDPPFDAFTVLY